MAKLCAVQIFVFMFLQRLLMFCWMTGFLFNMSRVFVGNLDPRVTERDLEDEFRTYGVIRRYNLTLLLVPLKHWEVSLFCP